MAVIKERAFLTAAVRGAPVHDLVIPPALFVTVIDGLSVATHPRMNTPHPQTRPDQDTVRRVAGRALWQHGPEQQEER
ncbi:MAG: hypothetical protein ACYDHM_11330 [Acidiferrobacterales bacterium]